MKIDWEKIVTNAISSLITMVFIGACVIVWQGATTVDTKVKAASENTKATIDYVQELVIVLQDELTQIKDTQGEQKETQEIIQEQLYSIRTELEQLNQNRLPNFPMFSKTPSIPEANAPIDNQTNETNEIEETPLGIESPEVFMQQQPRSKDFIMNRLPELKYKY